MSTTFWVSNPNMLNMLKFWPSNSYTVEENMNNTTVLSIYIAIILSIIVKSFVPLYMGTLAVGIIAFVYYIKYNPEQFTNYRLRYPTPNNPFMNVNPTDYDRPQEYKDYYRYKIEEDTPKKEYVEQEVKDDFTLGLYQDPNGKLWERHNSQREYISQPVGSVPNDQSEFAQWLYGREYVCKTGSIYDRYGLQYTPDSLVCSGFEGDGRLTNMGIKR